MDYYEIIKTDRVLILVDMFGQEVGRALRTPASEREMEEALPDLPVSLSVLEAYTNLN